MGCKICGRGSCAESFHSLEQQEEHEKRQAYESAGDCYDCYLAQEEIGKLEDIKNELLEALIEVVRISDRDHNAWHKAKAVIKQAKGE